MPCLQVTTESDIYTVRAILPARVDSVTRESVQIHGIDDLRSAMDLQRSETLVRSICRIWYCDEVRVASGSEG